MPYYYVNKNAQSTGEHEVHTTSCNHGPLYESNKQSLGSHSDCKSAVQAAKQYYSNVDGCYYCCNECHTR